VRYSFLGFGFYYAYLVIMLNRDFTIDTTKPT